MSGKPYPEGVVEVVKLLEQHEALTVEIEELRPKALRFNDALKDLERADCRLQEMLNKMDIESQGNFGFGGRMGWFLLAMRRLSRGEKP